MYSFRRSRKHVISGMGGWGGLSGEELRTCEVTEGLVRSEPVVGGFLFSEGAVEALVELVRTPRSEFARPARPSRRVQGCAGRTKSRMSRSRKALSRPARPVPSSAQTLRRRIRGREKRILTSDEFRKMALDLPEVVESSHMGHPDFRVGSKIFATLGGSPPDPGWGMVKLTLDDQDLFVQIEPEGFQPVRGGWGRQGATERAAAIRKEKNRACAPCRLAQQGSKEPRTTACRAQRAQQSPYSLSATSRTLGSRGCLGEDSHDERGERRQR